MKEVLREMLPYYVPLAVTLLLITYVPADHDVDPALGARELITQWRPR